ncbi:hypothetical protein [Ferruginibacter albus]|uniref:hypothetical protein n=1 Tax=Ferruginibacter albus TaxID=2875540 RepID=UPI001CC69AEE|nr:hypothetical protein [Ferruginibacter albus]UAY51148.1 hypothetical protein K9M53_11165 [Ferruginibacter albus]
MILILLGLAIAIYIFKSVNDKSRARRENRHEQMLNKQEELIQLLKNKTNNDQIDEMSDTTKDE